MWKVYIMSNHSIFEKLEHIDLCTPLESIMSGIVLKNFSDYGKTFVDYFNRLVITD